MNYYQIRASTCTTLALAFVLVWLKLACKYNYFFLLTVEGICDNALTEGVHTIGIYIGSCNNSTETVQPTRLLTGLQTPSRLTIEELRPETSVDTSKKQTSLANKL